MPENYVGAAPRPRQGSAWPWVLGALAVLLALFIASLVALFYWGVSMFTAEARTALQRDPVIVEHIGTIRTLEADIIASGEEEGADDFVFAIEGDKGSGKVLARLVTEDDGEVLHGGTLTLADGRELPLAGGAADAETETDGEVAVDGDAPPLLTELPDDSDPAPNYKDGAREKTDAEPPQLEAEDEPSEAEPAADPDA
jgi:hypothetical protein